MKSNTPPVTLEELVGEYERELDVRKRGYPKFVQAGKLTREEAARLRPATSKLWQSQKRRGTRHLN
jgi:hypothetical protein